MKAMKKLAALLLALSMAFALAACSSDQGSTPTPSPTVAPSEAGEPSSQPSEAATEPTHDDNAAFTTVEPGKLHMSTNAAFPPYEMTTDDGGFEGIDVEVAEAIAKKLGLELVVDDMGFDAALLAVQNGQSDIAMAGITVKPDRQEVMDFTDPYTNAVQVIIVNEDSPIQSIDDLANAQMIGCQRATTGYEYCAADPEDDGYGADHVTAYETGALAVMDLVQGKVDAVVIDNEPAKAYVAQNPGLKILDTEFANEEYAIAVKKGNTALLDAVNAAMAELKADGTFQKIVDKYIKAD
mgnify:CR=1 FL=1